MIKEITILHEEMRDITLTFASVHPKAYDRVLAKVDLYTEEELTSLLFWLRKIKDELYKEVMRIYRMPANPQHAWANYKLHGIEGLQEQRLMVRAAYRLKEVWSKPYKPERIIRRGKAKHDIVEGSDCGISIQSEGGRADESDRGSE